MPEPARTPDEPLLLLPPGPARPAGGVRRAAPRRLAGHAAALRDTGWHNYSLFLRDDGLLIGYVEADDLEAAQEAMAATEVNTRWQAEMAEFFTGIDGRPPDEGFVLLPEIFHLETSSQPHLTTR